MCVGPKAPVKACGACGEYKDATRYSKKQWAAKSTRRCKSCVEAGIEVSTETEKARAEAYAVAPAPKAACLLWDLYYLLLGAGKDDVPADDRKGAYTKATTGLSEPEIRESAFADRPAAALAAIRGMALLETPAGPDGPPAAFLLVSRAMLWLARDALRARPLEIDVDKYEKMHDDGGQSLQLVLKCYTLAIRRFPHAAPLALGLYAHACARMVASQDGGQFNRPTWGEAWLARAECEVFLGELHAAAHAKRANGKRPPGRRGPWDDDAARASFFDEAELLAQDAWEVDVPGHPRRRVGAPGSPPPRTRLADYWWGQEGDVARASLLKYSMAAIAFLDLARSNAEPKELATLSSRIRDCECGAYRRAAAALSALSSDTDAADERLQTLLDRFRQKVPGTSHEPSDGFCAALPREDGAVSLWAVADVDGCVVVVDCGGEAPHAGSVLALAEGAAENPEAVVDALKRAMAGAGPEHRCLAGPPRRPRSIEFHAELSDARDAFAGLAEKLEVATTLAKAGPKRSGFKAAKCLRGASQLAFAAGDAIVVDGLVSKAQHNGRKGDVVRYLPEKGRFEVLLKAGNGLAEASLALKAEHLSIVG
mmetsp:Transcript_34272/g.105307  ORF Transcript_34272/g.105307 Transcript_34272/m.105307 type:complete len:597 (+) Transcript_34272:212-2002(+)